MQNHVADPFGIVGQVLDAQFRVDRLVGEGGFSAVYRGHHLGLEEPIAIKCLKLPPSLSPPLVDQFVKRFRDESRILYRLSQGNLNIVRSIAAGTWHAPSGMLVPYMILEWMEGRSLANEFTIRRTVGQQGRSLPEIVKLFASAADGLGYAHAQGVVHRDLNPGNLFLTETPHGMRMKVLDFGVAKIIDDSAMNLGPRTATVGQIRIFAPAYGAPEQFDDAIGRVGAASDVYAFTLIMLEAMRDRCVNEGTHLGEFAQRAIDPGRRPTPRALGLDVPDEVEQILARATKLDPRERWQSVGELWQALSMATSAASHERHAQAALETPALVMPNVRSTKTGMGTPPKTPGTGRMDRTMPIGAVLPNLPRPSSSVDRAPSSPRVPQAPQASPRGGPPPLERSTQRFPGDPPQALAADPYDDVETRTGVPIPNLEPRGDIPNVGDLPENEEEVTRVRAPDVDILRGLADADLRRPNAQTMTQASRGSPRPAAGAPAFPAPIPAAGSPPSPPDPAPPSHAGTAPSHGKPAHGGTLMMSPGFSPAQLALAQAQLAAGQAPQIGMPALAPSHAIGAPTQAPPPQAPPQPHQGPFGTQGGFGNTGNMPGAIHSGLAPQPPAEVGLRPAIHSPHGMAPGMGPAAHPMASFPQVGAPPPHSFADSMSLPPASVAGVPKKSNGMLYALVGFGFLLVVGIGAMAVVFFKGRRDDAQALPSATVSSTVATAAPTPTPTPTPTPDPTPTPATEPTPAETDAAAPAPAPSPTVTTTPEVTPPPPVPPTPQPTVIAVKDAGPPVDPNAFDEGSARSKLGQASSVLVFCKKEGGVTGPGTASVTFGTDGSVTAVSVDPPYAGTPAGECVAGQFRRTKISSFQGFPRTIRHSFEVPK